MRLAKVFNNNVVLATDAHGREFVLMGRGVGFQRQAGSDIDPATVERTFQASATDNPERFAALIDAIPPEHIALAEAIVALASAEFGDEVAAHALIPLADHLSFALRRASSGQGIEYPLGTEVALLYPREVGFARSALDLVTQRTGVQLPAIEAVPMALHFVNAQLGSGRDLGRVVEVTQVFADVVEVIERRFGIELDSESLDVARFITHLRYLFVRQQQGRRPAGGQSVLEDGQSALENALRSAHPAASACAEEIQQLLVKRFGWTPDPDELVYLTLYVARLTDSTDEDNDDS